MMSTRSQEHMLMILEVLAQKPPSRCSRKWSWRSFPSSAAPPPTPDASFRRRRFRSRPNVLAALTIQAVQRPGPDRAGDRVVARRSGSRFARLAWLGYLMSWPRSPPARWIWEQYDHMVMADPRCKTQQRRRRGRRARHRWASPSTYDVTPRYCASRSAPRRGAGGRRMLAQSHHHRHRSSRRRRSYMRFGDASGQR